MAEKISKQKITNIIRRAIQIVFFFALPSLYTAAFSGVKYIFRQMGAGQLIENNSFFVTLIWLCVFTICFGRIFCGFACAFGSLGDAVYGISAYLCKKMKRKPFAFPKKISAGMKYIKYVILFLVVITCFLGKDAAFSAASPWEVFSLIYAGHLEITAYIPGILILFFILVGMFFQERFFCQYLCPMGAVFSLLPVLPVVSYTRKKSECIKGCSLCTNKCPMNLTLPYEEEDGSAAIGECIRCGKCKNACPKKNICENIVMNWKREETEQC